MKKLLLTTLLLVSLALCIQALCDPERLFIAYEVNSVKCPNDVIRKEEKWVAYFPGYNSYSGRGIEEAIPYGTGWCQSNGNQCWPDFDVATVEHGRDAQGRQTWKWRKLTHDKNLYCQRSPGGTHEAIMRYTCPNELAENCGITPGWDGSCPSGGPPNEYGMCCLGGGTSDPCGDTPPVVQCGTLVPETACSYTISGYGSCYSPVLIDVAGDGFSLTDAAHGVLFDLDGNPDGVKEQVSWTQANSDDAWLALDRNRNGVIDTGRELFGNLTIQPASAEGNGFLALAQYDTIRLGGNADGVMDSQDAVFPFLRLWQDANHNGVSEANELQPLAAHGLQSVELNYKESKRTDAHGNAFKYRAKVRDVRGAQVNRWAWDVFLVKAP